MRKFWVAPLLGIFWFPLFSELQAAPKLAGIFTDQMVLQRDAVVPVWGWADPGENIVVEFGGKFKVATADTDGKWSVKLDPLPASIVPEVLTVRGNTSVSRRGVLVGDVWLCTGQGNMGISMKMPPNDLLQKRIASAAAPLLRLYQTAHQFSAQPAEDTSGQWQEASPETVRNFSAIGYLFGEKIQTELGVPIGMIESAMGGTRIENWLPESVLAASPANAVFLKNHAQALAELPNVQANYERELNQWKSRFPNPAALAAENLARKKRGESELRPPRKPAGLPGQPEGPSACFNGKIAPLVPFALRGILWYQGEGNLEGFASYGSQLSDLLLSWRALWKLPDLPFLIADLAPYGTPSEIPQDSARARFGEIVGKVAKSDGKTWMITQVDAGDSEQIHPSRKEIPAERFAAMALAKVYGRTDQAHGPQMASWKVDSGKVVVHWGAAGRGLVVKAQRLGGQNLSPEVLRGFEVAGADRRFYPAQAVLGGKDTVVVSAAEVPQPVAVRYGWAAFPLANLFNEEGFPAYPFRTDDWPWPDALPVTDSQPGK
jgi:sialate O-acetylesterase